MCLRSGDYSRALDLLRRAAADCSNDAELSDLEKLAQDGVTLKLEADRLITESQELFTQQKSVEAIAVLRKAYELDKRNSLARSILANSLVEHAQSILETDWLEAEKLTNQALSLNAAHPTAKTILNRLVEQKENSSVEDWVSQARKLQSSGDLFGALAWVAEGLAVHPHDPKLLQIQDEIQRDQSARRRQARRGDLDDLRRMQREIDAATDVAAKQALAARIQTVAAKHWTDGEILSIANALLLRLGLVSQESSGASPRSKGGTLILHVPRPNTSTASRVDTNPAPRTVAAPSASAPLPTAPAPAPPTPAPAPAVSPGNISQDQPSPNKVLPEEISQNESSANQNLPNQVPPTAVAPAKAPLAVPPTKIPPKTPAREKVRIAPPDLQLSPKQAATVVTAEPVAPPAKVTAPSSGREKPASSNAPTLILVSAAAIILVAATFFFTRRHYAPSAEHNSAAAPVAPVPAVSPAADPAPVVSAPVTPNRADAAPATSSPTVPPSSDVAPSTLMPVDQAPAQSDRNAGTLLVIAGQDDAKVFLNGKLQRQLTRAGQLRLPNLELKDYVVQVSKSGFQDPPQQTAHIRKAEEATLIFNLQPQPHLASLTIQGATPGTTVLVDQTPIGTVQPDGTLSVSTVNPGDHTVELRKDHFKPHQLKEHFVVGGTVALNAADTSLEAAPGELKITFTPADAKVALVRGGLLKMVSSGVPLNLDAGTYTLTARTADRITRSGTVEVAAGQSKTLDLSLAPNGMSKWDDPSAWKHEGDSFTRRGGEFALFGVSPTSGTFALSAMPTKGHLLQWVFNYTDPKNYILFQMDDNNFYRSVIRNGQKSDEIIVPHKIDKKTFRTLQIRVTSAEIVHQIKQGESWIILDRWAELGVNLSQGKFGFYIPGNDQVSVSTFAHYADLNIR